MPRVLPPLAEGPFLSAKEGFKVGDALGSGGGLDDRRLPGSLQAVLGEKREKGMDRKEGRELPQPVIFSSPPPPPPLNRMLIFHI